MIMYGLNRIFRRLGYEFNPYPNQDVQRRMKMIKTFKIDHVFDIGANTGQFALSLRNHGYRDKIFSFEPLKAAFNDLAQNARKDSKWEVFNNALGDEDTESIIHIAANSQSSSILKMLPTHLNNAPESKYIDNEKISIKKLDSVFPSLCDKDARVMLKIDTQGFEKHVLDGATNSLELIQAIQLEMSLVPLYENEFLYEDMLEFLTQLGFKLYTIENGFWSQTTGQLFQIDGLFVRNYPA